MPQNTPRGYTYPCYSDANNFPAQIQDLATDLDSDINALDLNIDDGRDDPPSLRISSSAGIAMAAGSAVLMDWSSEAFDNSGMFTPTSTAITATVEGLYMISVSVLFTSSSGFKTVAITMNNFLRAVTTRRSQTGNPLTVNVHGLVYAGAGSVFRVYSESSTASSAVTRNFTATRMTGNTLL